MRWITLGVGAALGYLLGSAEGRRNLEKMTQNAKKFWEDPQTQQKVHEATEAVKAKAPEVAEKVTATAKDVSATVQEKVNETQEKVGQKVNEAKDEKAKDDAQGNVKAGSEKSTTGHGSPKADKDSVSDPAQSLENEGGGPARH